MKHTHDKIETTSFKILGIREINFKNQCRFGGTCNSQASLKSNMRICIYRASLHYDTLALFTISALPVTVWCTDRYVQELSLMSSKICLCKYHFYLQVQILSNAFGICSLGSPYAYYICLKKHQLRITIRLTCWENVYVKQKKKKNCCVALKWNFWIFGLVSRIFFFSKAPKKKYKILMHFPPFFLKKMKKSYLTKLGCIQGPNF